MAKSLGHEKYICLSLINRANALWRLGRYPEAKEDLKQAAATAEQPEASRGISSWFSLVLARMLLSERRLPDAKLKSRQTLVLAGTQLKGTVAEATYTLGLAETFSNAVR